jgi:hypothetical protein
VRLAREQNIRLTRNLQTILSIHHSQCTATASHTISPSKHIRFKTNRGNKRGAVEPIVLWEATTIRHMCFLCKCHAQTLVNRYTPAGATTQIRPTFVAITVQSLGARQTVSLSSSALSSSALSSSSKYGGSKIFLKNRGDPPSTMVNSATIAIPLNA